MSDTYLKVILASAVGGLYMIAYSLYYVGSTVYGLRWNGLGQDWSVGLYNFRNILYLGVCTSIVTPCYNSYGSSFSIAVNKKINIPHSKPTAN